MNIDIAELLKAEIITSDTAVKIEEYYRERRGTSTNWLFAVFGILGSILVGLGTILIIAHNWDEIPRLSKTVLAFIPLIIGQVACGYTLMKRERSVAWREGASAFLLLSVGATISLVSQTYHIEGNLSSFVLTWMLLSIPIIYVMRSSTASLLYLIGVTYYICEVNYWSRPSLELDSFWMQLSYWGLLSVVIPHYLSLFRRDGVSNSLIFHNWLIPLSVTAVLGVVSRADEDLMLIAYSSLYGLLYLIGDLNVFRVQKLRSNGYKVIGSVGTTILLMVLSFDEFWESLRGESYQFSEIVRTPEVIAATVITVAALLFLYLRQRGRSITEIKPISLIFILFILTFIVGLYSPNATVLINLYILSIGVITIRNGAKRNHLGVLNYGLIIVTILIICRFFDTDLSFIIRGLLFILVGVGFFLTNYWMLKRRREEDRLESNIELDRELSERSNRVLKSESDE